jgi:hypothetical protein
MKDSIAILVRLLAILTFVLASWVVFAILLWLVLWFLSIAFGHGAPVPIP